MWALQRLRCFFLICLFFPLHGFAQSGVYPCTVNTNILPPYTSNLSDYVGTSAYRTQVNVTFNDAAEDVWDTRLRITIEGNGLTIQTQPDFRPAAPLTLYYGANTLTGNDLSVYFNASNTIVEGASRNEVFSNNKLPEGFYTICVQILDYRSNKILSNKSCAFVQMQLPGIPLPITPRCAAVVPALQPQQILFSWNPVQSVSNLSATPPEYQITMYEVTDPASDPLYALQNNHVLQVFASNWMQQTTYLYTLSDPALDPGKRYVYRIQAKYLDEEIQIKNNGYSEPCYFYFGYPIGGTIQLSAPDEHGTFKTKDPLDFSWSEPNNLLPNQPLAYTLTLVKLSPGQSPEDAFLSGQVYYKQSFPETFSAGTYQVNLPITLAPMADYAWKVEAYSGQQLIAQSLARSFSGPSLLEKFYAGTHAVFVEQTYNDQLQSLSGRGRVHIGDGKEQTIEFQNVYLQYVAGNFTMGDGEIIQALSDTTAMDLFPKEAINSTAYFHPSHLKLDRYGMKLKGYVRWPFPHAAEQESPQVYSKAAWYDYNTFKLIGASKLTDHNAYTLLEPGAYRMELANYSDLMVYENEYTLNIHGKIVCPSNITGSGLLSAAVTLPFKDAIQLHYISNNTMVPEQAIVPVKNLAFHLEPLDYIIDLSESVSPGKQAEDQRWKGVYFLKTNLRFLPEFDLKGQMGFVNDTRYLLEPTAADSNICYLDMYGQTFSYIRQFSGYNVRFNTYPAYLTDVRISILHDVMEDSYLKGSLLIPFISATVPFHYTSVLTAAGLHPGYMTDLDQFAFTFHPDKPEEAIKINIHSGVFADQERLELSMDIEWPYLKASISNLTGFRAWGDYHIGFYGRKGTRLLTEQVQGEISEYPFTITSLGAGRGAGKYAIGFSGNVRINEEVSGEKGPPLVNIYSLVPNALIPFEEDGNGYLSIDEISSSGGVEAIAATLAQQKATIAQQLQSEANNSISTIPNVAASISLSEYQSEPASLILPESEAGNEMEQEVYKGLRAKLSDKEYAVVEQFFHEFIKLGTSLITQPINRMSDTIVRRINGSIDKSVVKVNVYVARSIHTIIDSITVKVARPLVKDGYDPTEIFQLVGDSIAQQLSIEINNSIRGSIAENVQAPIARFIRVQLVDSTNAFIIRELSGMTDELMNGNYDVAAMTARITSKLPDHLKGVASNLLAFVKPKNVTGMLEKTALDAIRNIDLGRVAEKLTHGFIKNGPAIVRNTLETLAENQVNALVQNLFAATPGLNAVAPPGISMNFENIGEKIKSGRIDQIVTLDPTNIAINTKFVSFSGQLRQIKDEVYGNAWRGAFAVTVKQPKPFGVDAVYMSGKKDDHEYWFCQVAPGDPNGKTGGQLSKECKPFSTPANIGPVQIVAGTGRVYKGMREVSNGLDIVPDPTNAFGAYFSLVMFDAKNMGKTVRMEVAAQYVLDNDDHFIIDFNGNVQVMSEAPTIKEADPLAMVNGSLHLYYNSKESHFLAEGAIKIYKPGSFCGQGSFMLETKPGFWRLAVGEREFPVQVILACNSWGVMAWMYVDQQQAEFGAGIGYYLNVNAGFDLGIIRGGIAINAGVEVKIWMAFQYNPKIRIDELGVEAHGFVHISVYYSTKIKSGSFNLVDIDIYLGGIVHINPKPSYLNGYIKGRIAVLSFGINFEANIKKEI